MTRAEAQEVLADRRPDRRRRVAADERRRRKAWRRVTFVRVFEVPNRARARRDPARLARNPHHRQARAGGIARVDRARALRAAAAPARRRFRATGIRSCTISSISASLLRGGVPRCRSAGSRRSPRRRSIRLARPDRSSAVCGAGLDIAAPDVQHEPQPDPIAALERARDLRPLPVGRVARSRRCPRQLTREPTTGLRRREAGRAGAPVARQHRRSRSTGRCTDRSSRRSR